MDSYISSFKCWLYLLTVWVSYLGFPGSSLVKNLPTNAEDTGKGGLIPRLESSPGGRNGNPLQYSCLENPMGRGAGWATVHKECPQRAEYNWAHTCMSYKASLNLSSHLSEMYTEVHFVGWLLGRDWSGQGDQFLSSLISVSMNAISTNHTLRYIGNETSWSVIKLNLWLELLFLLMAEILAESFLGELKQLCVFSNISFLNPSKFMIYLPTRSLQGGI